MKLSTTMKVGFILLALITTMTACKKTKEGDTVVIFKQNEGKTLAEVGATKLTLEEMSEDFLSRQGTFRGAANLNTDKTREDYVENTVMQEAMFQKAIQLGYFDKADIKRDVKKIVVQRLVRDKLDEAQNKFVPTEEQMLEHYEKNKNFYNREESIKVAYISVPFGADKTKSKEVADLLYKDAKASVKNNNTREFGRLAMKHATTLAANGKITIETNETDYLDKAAFEEKFGANSFDAVKEQDNLGDIKPVHTTQNAYVIMMKTGLRKAINESFAQAKPKITKRLAYDSRNEFYKKFMDELRAEFKIKVNKEMFAELSKDLNPPAKPNPLLNPNAVGETTPPAAMANKAASPAPTPTPAVADKTDEPAPHSEQ